MKKTYNVFISLFFAFLLISCSQEEFATDSTSTEVQISSSLSSEDYVNAIVQINEKVRFSTRSSGDELTGNDAISILQPFAKDGLVIRDQLISQKTELSFTPQDVSELEGMTDSQLAELSFAIMTICNEASAKGVSWGDIGGLPYACNWYNRFICFNKRLRNRVCWLVCARHKDSDDRNCCKTSHQSFC